MHVILAGDFYQQGECYILQYSFIVFVSQTRANLLLYMTTHQTDPVSSKDQIYNRPQDSDSVSVMLGRSLWLSVNEYVERTVNVRFSNIETSLSASFNKVTRLGECPIHKLLEVNSTALVQNETKLLETLASLLGDETKCPLFVPKT